MLKLLSVTAITGVMLIGSGVVASAVERLNRAECIRACDMNAPDPAACKVRYQCDSQRAGPINQARVDSNIQEYNKRKANSGGGPSATHPFGN
jgi:hypothetical protein